MSSQKIARMIFNFKKKLEHNIFGLLYSVIAVTIFTLILKIKIVTDIQAHIEILEIYLDQGSFPFPPLYYFSIYVMGFILYGSGYIIPAILVLSAATIIKYVIVKKYMGKDAEGINLLMVDAITFSLMFVAPLFLYFFEGSVMYLGKFTSTIWHNSTTIFVLPISLWLFIESLKYLKRPSGLLVLKMAGIAMVILLSKPSFLFAFIVAFPLICLFKFGFTQKYFWYTVLLSSGILLALLVQKNIIYQNAALLDKFLYKSEPSKVIIAPFQVWLLWTKYPIVNFLSSFLFLLSFALLKFRQFKRDIEIGYAVALLLVSLTIFFTIAESGPRFFHGNFYWQIPISLLIVHMVFLKKLLIPYFKEKVNISLIKKISSADKIILLFFASQLFSGLLYTLKIILTKNYY